MRLLLTSVFIGVFLVPSAWSATSPGPRYEAASNEKGKFISDGFYVGGQRSVNAVKLKDIRRASRKGFERVVFDLVPGTEDRITMPYFQVQAASNENRIVVSIWADVQYDYDANQVDTAFEKSHMIKHLNVVPRVEDGLATIELQLAPKKGQKPAIKVFHLASPSRIVVDIRS